MDRVPEPFLPPEPEGAVTRRGFAWGALGLLLAGGIGTRLAGYGPASAVMPGLAVVQLPALTEAEAEAALADPTLFGGEATALLAAVRRRRMHLVRMPIFGIDSGVGATLRLSCGALDRVVQLGVDPTAVLLPIERAGRVVLAPVAAASITAGIVQTVGPTPLPPIPAGTRLVLNVIVE